MRPPPPLSFRDVVMGQSKFIAGSQRGLSKRAETFMAPSLKRFSAVVTAKDSQKNKSPEEIKRDVLAALDPVKDKMRIDNMRKTRQGLIIDAATEEDLQKIQDNVRISQLGLDVRPARRLRSLYMMCRGTWRRRGWSKCCVRRTQG